MAKKPRTFVAKAAAVLAAIPVLIYAYSGGPDPGYSGVPGEANCTSCHSGTVNSGPGSVSVAFPGGQTYTPGVTQRLTVTVADPDQRRWGFQLTVRRAADPAAMAGTLSPADGNSQTICATAALVQTACSSSTLQYVEHTSGGTRNGQLRSATFDVDWTPPATDSGNLVVYVAGNAANGDGTNSNDHIYTKTYTLTPAAGGPKPAIAAGGVVNGATFQPGISQGSWATIRGSNFGSGTRVWRADEIVNGNLPTQLDNISVNINGKPAFVYFISPEQINVQAPSDASTGDVPVEVVVNGVKSDTAMARLQPVSPGFFLWVNKYVVTTDPNFNWKIKPGTFPGATTTPAKPGEVIILWGTGFGPTSPAMPAGRVVDSATTRSLTEKPVIRIGGVVAEYLGGALSPGSAGLYQIVVRVPESTPDGDWPVVAETGGIQSPETALLTVQK